MPENHHGTPNFGTLPKLPVLKLTLNVWPPVGQEFKPSGGGGGDIENFWNNTMKKTYQYASLAEKVRKHKILLTPICKCVLKLHNGDKVQQALINVILAQQEDCLEFIQTMQGETFIHDKKNNNKNENSRSYSLK